MKAFATILVLVSVFGQLKARHPALSEVCLNGERSAEDCCALVPRAFYAHLKHPTNCGQFYHCAHGVPVLKHCPAGLHWSVKMDRCEWPFIAKCNGTNTSTTTTTTPKPTTTSTTASTTTAGTTTDNSGASTCRTASISNDCRYGKTSADECCVGVSPWEDALLPNPGSCGTYIQCVHEKPMVRDCPAGLHWSPDACRCEWPSIAKCNGTTTTTTTPKPTTTSTTPKPTTTSTTSKPTTTSTAASTTTTTARTTTDSSETSTCRTATISNDCRYGKTSADECCVGVSPWEDALLPDPGNCGTYLQCVHEKPMVRDCPAGLHWSPDACRCEWPSIAKCNGTTTTTTTTTTPKPTTTSTAASTTTSTVAPTTTTTARPTTDSSETSTCRTATISNDCRYGKTSADECCVGVSPWEDALLPDPGNCGTYLQCVHEKPMVRDCPAGLHWSPDACRCEWPSIAKCNGTTTTTTTTTTTPKPTTTSTAASTTTSTVAPTTTTTARPTTDSSETSTCITATISNDCRYGKKSADECCAGVSPWEDALLPNPDSCGTYLQCVHEKPMVRDCPAGLHWSPDECRCEWPAIAKCA